MHRSFVLGSWLRTLSMPPLSPGPCRQSSTLTAVTRHNRNAAWKDIWNWDKRTQCSCKSAPQATSLPYEWRLSIRGSRRQWAFNCESTCVTHQPCSLPFTRNTCNRMEQRWTHEVAKSQALSRETGGVMLHLIGFPLRIAIVLTVQPDHRPNPAKANHPFFCGNPSSALAFTLAFALVNASVLRICR